MADTMLLALVIWGSVAVCAANPLHKYPYVFLLDVGNEEMQQTKTAQLRVSIPGGSLAMKYPAMGEGDLISHVRVSGIDFGTDLKVNIVEGGPGYKHVVLMFMGNPGVSYDAVVTLQTQQTLPTGTEINLTATNRISTTEDYPYEVSEADSDDQDLINDSKDMKQYNKKSKEVTQSTSTFYNYAKKEMADSDEDKETENVSAEEQDVSNENDSVDDDDDDDDDEGDNDFSNNGNRRFFNGHKYESSHQDSRKDSDEDETESNENEEDKIENGVNIETKLYREPNIDQFNEAPRAEKYRYNVNLNNADNAKPDDIYDNYQGPKPHFGLGFRVYPQSFIYSRQYQGNSGYNKEDPAEFRQMYSNEESPDNNKFKDGSNSIDPDYVVAEY